MIPRMTREWVGLAMVLIVLASSIALGQGIDGMESSFGILSKGSTQVILSLCLVAVTFALCVVSKELVRAYKERISALERMVNLEATKATSEQNLADALRELKTHCETIHAIHKRED